MEKLRYYWLIVRYMIRHRNEPNNRQKWRRLQRELPNNEPQKKAASAN